MKILAGKGKTFWLMPAVVVLMLGALALPFLASPPKALAAPLAPTASTSSCIVVTYILTNQWSNGFTASITITNHCATAILACWKLGFTFPAGQMITQSWNVSLTQSGSNVTVIGCTTIPPGGSFTFGIVGTWYGTNSPPVNFVLNGMPV
jgi:hypothetical protein